MTGRQPNVYAWVIAAVAGAILGTGITSIVSAQGIKRTPLQRANAPGSQTHEVITAIAEIAPHAAAGKHTHPGIEMSYVMSGEVTLEVQGKPAATFKAGESFQVEPLVPHDARNNGNEPAKVLAVYVVEKGKPLADPVK